MTTPQPQGDDPLVPLDHTLWYESDYEPPLVYKETWLDKIIYFLFGISP